MEKAIEIKNLYFKYPNGRRSSLENINFSADCGEFIVIAGGSGCGKSTLLRQMKKSLSPHGERQGEIFVFGEKIEEVTAIDDAEKIAMVMQEAENQIVTDKVYHELAFGLESLGVKSERIRRRVAEVSAFFGIEEWFYRSVTELSGGQKQILNLAAAMVTEPKLLLLDEPTSQLDPIAAEEFLNVLRRINKELGITVIIAEHRLESLIGDCDKLCLMHRGKIGFFGDTKNCGEFLREHSETLLAMPSAMRIWFGADGEGECPLNTAEGRKWLAAECERRTIREPIRRRFEGEPILEMKKVYFRYEKEADDVLSDFNLTVRRGELLAVMGGNGEGKSTAARLMRGIGKPYTGTIKINGEKNNFSSVLLLPQNPKDVFTRRTAREELEAVSGKYEETARLCKIEDILDSHPYDISGGEMQRLALAKILLARPEILILDEPTKGLDAEFKRTLGKILLGLKSGGVTIILISHDTEFCARYADRCAMLFGGGIVSCEDVYSFFGSSSFYTTDASRMSRGYIPDAITAEDVIYALGGENDDNNDNEEIPLYRPDTGTVKPVKRPFFKRFANSPIAAGGGGIRMKLPYLTAAVICMALTVMAGMRIQGSRRYYITSMLLIAETLIPFFASFEGRKIKARELVVLATLAALAAASRAAFYMLPQFKPMAAVVIISGIALGGTGGFAVGATAAFVSNFFFGQGPWTPWQMEAFGLLGLLSGLIFNSDHIPCSKYSVSVIGAVLVFFVYGAIMNLSTALMYYDKLNRGILISTYALGVPFDAIHAAATFIFLWLGAKPVTEELKRIEVKYKLWR